MTIVVDAESAPLEQITTQLNKLIEIIKIVELDDTLHDALPLTDPELLEALLFMPVNQKG